MLLASRVFPPDVVSGISTVMWNLWDRLRRQHETRLVAGFVRDLSLLPRGCDPVRVDGAAVLRSRLAFDLACRLAARRFRPDVVVSYGIEVPPALAPTVGLLTDPHLGGSPWGTLRGLRDAFFRRRIGAMSVAVAPTQAARGRCIDFGIPAERIRVAWPGVDTVQLVPEEGAPALPDADSGEPARLLYAARIVPGKGQHVAIEAVKGLPERLRKRVRLALVGPVEDPQYFASLQRRAAGAPVDFHPQVPELAPWYRQAHIVLFPTTSEEVFGYSAVDGMACGKPVIFSRFSALEEATGGVGVPVPAGDVKALGQAIRELLQDPARCAELGQAGRKLVVERYSWERAAARYREIVEGVASGR
jgi:glycosyltransferase involved in cell wall biosynthesis